jgi:ankyrin repeat protein
MSPLHVAAASTAPNRLDIFNLLVQYGADVNAKDGQNTSVYQWARISKNQPVKQRILELHVLDPVWKGRIFEATTGSQLSRGIVKAPKKFFGAVGKATSATASITSNMAMSPFLGGTRKLRRRTRSAKRN